jgi:predicted PurR-regulated permease PerM
VTQRELVGRTVTVLALIALAWLLVWVISQITEILVLLLISAIFAAGLAPVVGVLEGRRLPGGLRFSRGAAIFVVYLVILIAVLLILSIIIVPAVNESGRFIQQLPQLLKKIRFWLSDLQDHWTWLPDIAGSLSNLPSLATQLSRFGPEAASVAFRFLGGLTAVITVLVFTFYMLLQGAEIKRAFLTLFPLTERARIIVVLDRIGAKFGGWLRAQLLLSVSVAVPVAIALSLLRVPYALLLAIVAGIGELIPMVGPALGATVAILVALSQQLWQLVGVIIFYVIIMNVEPHILVPRIMSRAVGTSPILTLVALLTGIKLIGILGGLLAVPIAAALQVIVSEVVAELFPTSDSAVLIPAASPDPPSGTPGRNDPRGPGASG